VSLRETERVKTAIPASLMLRPIYEISPSVMTQPITPPTAPTILLFARGVLALFDLWPALAIAVREQWGGPDSSDKRTWMASTIIDEFESRATYLLLSIPSAPSASSTSPASSSSPPRAVDPQSASDPPLDQDELGDLINQMMSDEFDANVEDGSIDLVASDIVRLWRDMLKPGLGMSAEDVVSALERKADEVRRTGVKANVGAELEEVDGDSESGSGSESGDGMDIDEEAPRLEARENGKEKHEPVIDDDGFTLVQAKGKKGR